MIINSNEFYLDVARGRVRNHSSFHGFGINTDVSTSLETLWPAGGLYVYPSTALIMSIVSTSADDAAAGIGLRTVLIEGLDTNREFISEVVTLNGLTPVLTTKAYLRINTILGLSAGSSGTNVGTISATNTGTTYTVIDATHGRSQNGFYSLPINSAGYVTAVNFSTSQGKAAQISSWVRPVNGIFFKAGSTYMFETATQIDLLPPVKIPKGADIEIRALATASGTPVAVGFDIIVIQE
jgi:hypothetical protein